MQSAPPPAGPVPHTMRAARYSKPGGPEVVEVHTDVPIPQRKGRALLVKIAAASLNPIDVKVRAMHVPPGLKSMHFPKTLCADGSGCVVAAPSDSKFRPGDVIAFYISGALAGRSGTAATYALVPEKAAALVPLQELDVVQAAALPLVSCTAWQALHKSMPLQGKTVLIQGGSGGVGTICIQIAKAQGATVVVTCSAACAEMCKGLGADECIDYKSERFEDCAATKALAPQGYDLVVNMVGGADMDTRCMQAVKRGGHFTQIFRMVVRPAEWWQVLKGKYFLLTGRLGAHTALVARGIADQGLEQVLRLVEEGRMRPVVSQVLPLEQVVEAQKLLERGSGVKGKIVLKVIDRVEDLLVGVNTPAA